MSFAGDPEPMRALVADDRSSGVSEPFAPATPAPRVVDEVAGVVASAERINAWMQVAREGDVFVYATRAVLPSGSRGGARMRELFARGYVSLTRPRSAIDPSLFNYTARRTGKPSPLTRPERPTLSAHLVDAEAALVDALLPVLERVARFGRPCPTDRQLADKAGIAAEAVQPGLEALVLAGLIRIHAAPRPTLRRVLIVSSGMQTGFAA